MLFARLGRRLGAISGSRLIAIFVLAAGGPRGVVACSGGSPGVAA